MSTPEEATKAIEMFNNTDFNGRVIQVKLDKFAGDSRNNNYNYRSGRSGYNNRGGYNNNRGKPYRGGRGGYNNSNRSPQRTIDVQVGNVSYFKFYINRIFNCFSNTLTNFIFQYSF